MSASPHASPARLPFWLWLVVGLALGLGAWLLPVNLKSVSPPLLRQAAVDTPSTADLGQRLLASEKLGPASLVLAAADGVRDPKAGALQRDVARVAGLQPELVPWGGWDPFLDPLFNAKENTGRTASTPVLTFFITEKARTALTRYLANTRSQGVQAVLAMRDIDRTVQFVPAKRAGGQTLDSVILLTALLYQGEHFSAPLQREIRGLAEAASQRGELGELETFFIDLLSLGRRLDWMQLGELLRVTDSTKTVGEYAQLARVTPDDLPLIYTAALFSDSADRVASYLLRYGKAGVEDLRLALGFGQGAVRQLVLRQVPVNRGATLALGAAAEFGLLHPKLALGLKYLGFLLGAFCLFSGLERWLFATGDFSRLPRMKSGALAVLTAGVVILATEPFLLKAAPPSEFTAKLSVPVLASLSDPASLTPTPPTFSMDTKTLLSIGFFALLQLGMYVVCLLKIREIDHYAQPALVKLRLMENEENLFDGGLYIGIGGTATALVLQVLGIIEPNLLAAYSSNLFGITCVALVKIRHVRPFKRRLILESQPAPVAAPTASVPATS